VQGEGLRAMAKSVTKTQPVLEFVEIASQYRLLIDNRDQVAGVALLRQAYVSLARLCACASALPLTKGSRIFRERVTHAQWETLRCSLNVKIAEFDAYSEVMDPYESNSEKPDPGSLSQDLTDIYDEIVPGLDEWEQADLAKKRSIMSAWKLDFEISWGEHATGALRAIHFILFM
jgi:hypothetical protein